MPKSDATVNELVEMIERGELRLPEMQRRYVWRAARVRDLLDSLYRGYPSGAILIWETDEDVPLQDFAVAQARNPYRSTRLLLDGQQRLTALSALIRGEPVHVRGRRRAIDILFNIEHPEALEVVTEVNEDGEEEQERIEDEVDSSDDELQGRMNRMTFVVATRKLEQLPQWIRVSEVFKTDNETLILKRAGITSLDDARADKYLQRIGRLRAVKNYSYRIDILERTLSYDEVTEIFVRVNSLGTKLRSSDLAMAQITAKWRGALAVFQEYEAKCKDRNFPLDLSVHLKNMVAFATGQSRFRTVGNLSVETLQEAWRECVRGMDFALNFLQSNARIAQSPVLLSSPYLLITLGYFGHLMRYEIGAEDSHRLRQWLLMANAKGRYSRGSSETILDQDLSTLRQGGGVADLVERLRLQVGRLTIDPEELRGRNQRSAIFKTMFLAFRDAGARDWQSNLGIAMDHRGVQDRLQFHHIFPKAVLKGRYTSREADDIANLAFISGKTNLRISDKPPNQYLPQFVKVSGPEAFRAQCIPTESDILDVDSYSSFLGERRRRITERLNEFLAIAKS